MKKKIAVVSKCLLGHRCRYDGEVINYDLKEIMADRYRIIGICPEVSIGLSVPREPLRFVRKGDAIILIQEKTGLLLKRKLLKFSSYFLKDVGRVDIFVLKSRSPSCGNRDCKVFNNLKEKVIIGYTDGIFTSVCKQYFKSIPIYNEDTVKEIF